MLASIEFGGQVAVLGLLACRNLVAERMLVVILIALNGRSCGC